MESRYEGLQNRLWGIREGCFFLSLLSVAEEFNGGKVDFVDAVNKSFEKKWLKDDYTVLIDIALLEWLTGKKVRKEVRVECGIVRANQYSVAKWVNREGDKNHFRRRGWDVYTNSRTVKEGHVMCYYVYTIG